MSSLCNDPSAKAYRRKLRREQTDAEARLWQRLRNKQFADRFQLIGRTNGGRRLKIIFQLKRGESVRIITGWDL